MSGFDGHKVIGDLLKERPFASVRELREVPAVTAATVRRDIGKLHEPASPAESMVAFPQTTLSNKNAKMIEDAGIELVVEKSGGEMQ